MMSTNDAGGPSAEAPADFGPVTLGMVTHLRETKPWVRLMSVLGFIGSALMLVLGIFMPFLGAVSEEFGVVGGVAMGLVYLFVGFFYFFPSLLLFRYANAIRDLLKSGDNSAMESALAHQKRFWRLVGIATLVMPALYAVILVITAVVVILAALK
jgi:hypothetical protein